MIKIQKTFGEIYVDDWDDSKNFNNVIIYDSDKRYLDCWDTDVIRELAVERDKSPEEIFASWCDDIRNAETVNDMIYNNFGINIEFKAKDLELIKTYLEWDEVADGVFDYKKEDYVNRIGEYYIVTSD